LAVVLECPALPPELAKLAAGLIEHGYRVVEERADPEHFGDRLIVFAGQRTRVRIVRDRGQWFVDVATAKGECYEPVIWLAHLTGQMPPLDVPGLAADVEFVLKRLADIEKAAEDETGIVDESLFDWRWQRAAARRSMPPGEA
jgi:hypothetical protein